MQHGLDVVGILASNCILEWSSKAQKCSICGDVEEEMLPGSMMFQKCFVCARVWPCLWYHILSYKRMLGYGDQETQLPQFHASPSRFRLRRNVPTSSHPLVRINMYADGVLCPFLTKHPLRSYKFIFPLKGLSLKVLHLCVLLCLFVFCFSSVSLSQQSEVLPPGAYNL